MLRRVSRAESSRTIQSLAEENEDSEGEGDDLVERDSTRKLQSSNGSTPQNSDTMTVTVVQPRKRKEPDLKPDAYRWSLFGQV
ncbi:uncharacterized protein IUM83_08315 [Phytophthora cinnamomi]|uniref:uncharacterized protein n=1 Tax=Phytophthora cinnamomi TaxID=4785 RepID=UPI0035599233|nr:hypothetical protein IUM83_08315 [Phytophthora cinnamomi]